jgi:hypothetical protein
MLEKMNGIQILVALCYRLWFLFPHTYYTAVLYSLVLDVSGFVPDMSKRYAVLHGNRGDFCFPPSLLSNGYPERFAREEGNC